MHTEMWEHPATQANVAHAARARRRRARARVRPAHRRRHRARPAARARRDLRGRCPGARRGARPALAPTWPAAASWSRAGGTREDLDPVRFLGNRSSGRQGYALARTAAARGAEVTLVAANVALPDPAGAKVVRVVSARRAARGGAGRRRGRRRRGDGRRGRRLPARRREAGTRSRRPSRPPEPMRADREPGHPGRAGPPSRRPPGPGHRRVRRRDRRRRRSSGTAGPSSPRKGCDLLVVNEVGTGSAFGTRRQRGGGPRRRRHRRRSRAGPRKPLADVVWDAVAVRLA